MSNLYERLRADIVGYAKGREMDRVRALRTLDGAIQRAALDGNREIDDGLVTATIRKAIKDLKGANDSFAQGGRQDLIDANNAEITLLEEYLPKELSEAELEAAVVAAIAESGAKEKRDMGKVMGVLKRHPSADRMDFGAANRLIQGKLDSGG